MKSYYEAYDLINGYRINCFTAAILADECDTLFPECFDYIYGHYNSYQEGDYVPYTNYGYNYGPNFLIIDVYSVEYPNVVIHAVKNGKVYCTLLRPEDIYIGTQMDVSEFDNIIDIYGQFLNINNITDIHNYIRAQYEYNKASESFNEKRSKLPKLTKENFDSIASSVYKDFKRNENIIKVFYKEHPELHDVTYYGNLLSARTYCEEKDFAKKKLLTNELIRKSYLEKEYQQWQMK